MDTFVRFLYEFINQTVSGILTIFRGIIDGIKTMFDIKGYTEVFRSYYADFSAPEWILAILSIIFVMIFLGLIIFLVLFVVRKYTKLRKPVIDQEALLDEVATLNRKVATLSREKDESIAQQEIPKAGINTVLITLIIFTILLAIGFKATLKKYKDIN